jgi:hypothetical protein
MSLHCFQVRWWWNVGGADRQEGVLEKQQKQPEHNTILSVQ